MTTVPLYLQTAGRIGVYIVATALVLVGLVCLVPRRRPRQRDGFGFVDGAVVGRTEGRRPVVVEFTPHGSGAPVRFKAGAEAAALAVVPVRYSLADPRNATVQRGTEGGRTVVIFFGALALLAGIASFVGLLA